VILTEFSILGYGEEGLCKRDTIIPTASDAHFALREGEKSATSYTESNLRTNLAVLPLYIL
jgi:hypothetical protein